MPYHLANPQCVSDYTTNGKAAQVGRPSSGFDADAQQGIMGLMDISWMVKIIADGLVIPVVLIGIYTLIRHVPRGQRYQVYMRVLMAGLTAFVAAKIIGLLYQPSGLRPFELAGVSAGASFLDNPGFPSDHALFTMAITLAVWFGAKCRGWAVACLVMTLLVSIGRVVALVHTPLDVAGGLIIAWAGIFWYMPLRRVSRTAK